MPEITNPITHPDNSLPGEEFIHEVRSALTHLYDFAYLQNHPLGFRLTQSLSPGHPTDSVLRAQLIRRTLLDCIEKLRPETGQRPVNQHTATQSEAARAYVVLSYRFVDGLSMEEVEAKLALSRRQTYREYSKGIESVANLVWEIVGGVRSEGRGIIIPDMTSGINSSVLSTLPSPPITSHSSPNHPFTNRRAETEAEVERLSRDRHIEMLWLLDLVQGVAKVLSARLAQAQIALAIAIDEQIHVVVDRTLLRQALLNLLSHLVEAVAQPGQVTITAHDHRQGETVLEIEQRFTSERLRSTNTETSEEHEGLGLTVAQTLLEAQGGHLSIVSNSEGWISTIIFSSHQSPIVLLIDDNQDLLSLFRRYLGSYRVTIHSASNGRDGIELAERVHPNAIVLDVMLPQQDGWEILQALREVPALTDVPVIICSVLSEHSLALSLGANDTLTKPVTPTQLLDVLQRWLEKLHPHA